MQTENPDIPPERVSRPESFLGALRRTARTTAGPVLLLWMASSVVEFLIATWLADNLASMRLGPWWDVPADLTAWSAAPLAALMLPFVAAFRTALFLPARRAYEGEDPDLGEVFGDALSRLPPVLSTRIYIEVAMIVVVVGCFVARVRMPTVVLLMLGFSLAPALYHAATRQTEGPADSLWAGLRFSRRHWYAVFAAHGAGLIAILLLSPDGGAGVAESFGSLPVFPLDTLATLQVLGGVLTGRYLDWLIVTSNYLYLDPS